MLPCKVSVGISICNPHKPTAKYVRKTICDSNDCSSKLVNASYVCPGETIHGSNVRLSKPITASISRPS